MSLVETNVTIVLFPISISQIEVIFYDRRRLDPCFASMLDSRVKNKNKLSWL